MSNFPELDYNINYFTTTQKAPLTSEIGRFADNARGSEIFVDDGIDFENFIDTIVMYIVSILVCLFSM